MRIFFIVYGFIICFLFTYGAFTGTNMVDMQRWISKLTNGNHNHQWNHK